MCRPILCITALILVIQANECTAANTSGSDLSPELAVKLEALEQNLLTLQENLENLEKSQQSLQNELEAERQIRSGLEEEKLKQDDKLRDLELVFQTKLQSTSEECSSLKTQLIKFFSTVSSAKKVRNEQNSAKTNFTSLKEDGKAQSEMSDQFKETSDEKVEEVEKSTVDSIRQAEDDYNHIAATLEINSTGGVTYVRWGRTSCEGDADVLYIGFAAGKYREYFSNAGSDFICLHSTPELAYVVGSYRGVSTIAGVQYDFYDDDPFSKVNTGGQPLKDHDMPCTVCHVETRSHQLMIPARKSCPAGWTLEYWGYLVMAYYEFHGGSYKCVDHAPEATPGGSPLELYTQVIHAVEINCVGLLCPPYTQGYEVPCAVCSK